LLRAKAVGALGSAPTMEMWMTRRTPTFSQAANIAVVASTWTRWMLSPAPSCSTPTQLTTASMSSSSGSQSPASVRRR
jgi:hypothetical protein